MPGVPSLTSCTHSWPSDCVIELGRSKNAEPIFIDGPMPPLTVCSVNSSSDSFTTFAICRTAQA